jgi:hypothetical protein
MNYTNKLGLPAAIVAAVANDPYDAGDSDITVTGLIAPPRQRALIERHKDEITEDVANCVYRLWGSAIHEILERAGTSDLKEVRLFSQRNGWKFSGAFDNFAIESGTLRDYKTTTLYAVKDGFKSEWEEQLNILALLCREHWLTVKNLQVVAMLRDWSMGDAKRHPDHPQYQIVIVDIPLWDEAKAEAFLMERIELHQAARSGELPFCSDLERWKTSDKWAVMKKGTKRAKKLYMSEAEAGSACADAGAGHYVEHRIGEAKRCANYCSVAPFCKQWQDELAKAPQTEPSTETPEGEAA